VLSRQDISKLIEETGASRWGYVDVDTPISFDRFQNWVKKERHLPLKYLADHRLHLRSSFKKVFPDFKQAIVMLFSYSNSRQLMEDLYQNPHWNGWKVASYAVGFEGLDYHHVIGQRIDSLGQKIQKSIPHLKFQRCLDIHPVLERDLAYQAGLGWFGRNSMLIHQKEGSFVMIGTLLLSEVLVDQEPIKLEVDHCGNCNACVDQCPTEAIDGQNREIISSQCISTFTIEMFKDALPIPGHVERGQGEIFGCDICQDVCPWNNRPLKKTLEKSEMPNWILDLLLRPKEEVIAAIEEQTERGFRKKMQGTVLERLGRKGLLKNLKLIK
jgi:epoxyqueuosine reductase